MSHFPVAVITAGDISIEAIERALRPYQENNEGTCPKEYLEFVSTEEESRYDYENDEIEYVLMEDGRLLQPYNEEFRVDGRPGVYSANSHKVPEHLKRVRLKKNAMFDSFDEYMTLWECEERDKETGKYGYWENPNKKWDWWVVGGRWRGQVKATDGGVAKEDPSPYPNGGFDQASLADLIWEQDPEAAIRADKEWRAYVEGETIEGFDFQKWKTSWYLNQYINKENFVFCESNMWWRAVITPDGEWHEVGEMGWWGCSSEKDGQIVEWAKTFKEKFIDPYPDNYIITIVDCHI